LSSLRAVLVHTREVPDEEKGFALLALDRVVGSVVRVVDGGAVGFPTGVRRRVEPWRGKYQYLADDLLTVPQQMWTPGSVVLLLTSVDIYTRGMNYIFGLATRGAAVISSARIHPSFWEALPEMSRYLPEDKQFFAQQLGKVVVHEFGHTVGLPHCERWDCVMRFSNSPFELYRKGSTFCSDCWMRLLRLVHDLAV